MHTSQKLFTRFGCFKI